MYHVKTPACHTDKITRQRKSTHITTTTTAKCGPSFTTPESTKPFWLLIPKQ